MSRFVFSFLIILILIFSTRLSLAQESILQSQPVTGQASELNSPSSQIFDQPSSEPTPEKQKSNLDTFIYNSKLKLNLRSMYLNQEDLNGGIDNNKEKLSWATGGSLAIKTGKIAEIFDVRAEVFSSQKLFGPLNKDGALLLKSGQDSYTVLGVLNPRFEKQGHALSLYRQRLELPYLNSQDSRMTPNTFEGYNYSFIGTNQSTPIKFGGGYINKIKSRNQDDFIYMSEAAGVNEKERGMPWAGVRASPDKKINFSAANYILLDTLNILYADTDFNHKFSEISDFKLSLQYSNQTAIGSEFLDRESDSTEMYGSQIALSYKSAVLRSAVNINSSSGSLISPFGAYPGYNASMIENFNRAGEISWKIGLSYNLAAINLKGISTYVDYIQGNNAVDDAKQALPDNREVDVNIDFHNENGHLNGLWLRLRAGFVNSDSAGSSNDFWIILNYGLPILN